MAEVSVLALLRCLLSLLPPSSRRHQCGIVLNLETHLKGTGQKPLENLVAAIAEEAMGVDAVMLAVEPQVDLIVCIFRWTGCLKGDLC